MKNSFLIRTLFLSIFLGTSILAFSQGHPPQPHPSSSIQPHPIHPSSQTRHRNRAGISLPLHEVSGTAPNFQRTPQVTAFGQVRQVSGIAEKVGPLLDDHIVSGNNWMSVAFN